MKHNETVKTTTDEARQQEPSDRGAGSLVLPLDHSSGSVSHAVCGNLELEEIETMVGLFRTQVLGPALKAKEQQEAESRLRVREAEISHLLREKHGIELT